MTKGAKTKRPARAIGPVRREDTRERILSTALSLFRTRGFDRTTMRDVAVEAGVALGGAYYYFASKNDLVRAYYEQVSAKQQARVREVLGREMGVRERLGAVFQTSVDLLRRDRKLIAGIFRSVGEVGAVSPFSPETSPLRAQSVALFEEALEPAGLPDQTRRLLSTALWGGHMAMILYMMHDESKGQERTRKLVDGMLDTLVPMLPALPLLGPTLHQLSTVLEDAGLVRGQAPSPQ